MSILDRYNKALVRNDTLEEEDKLAGPEISESARTAIKEFAYGYQSSDWNGTRSIIHGSAVHDPKPDDALFKAQWKVRNDNATELDPQGGIDNIELDFATWKEMGVPERQKTLSNLRTQEKDTQAASWGLDPEESQEGYGWARGLGMVASALSDPLVFIPIGAGASAVKTLSAAMKLKSPAMAVKPLAASAGIGGGLAATDYAVNRQPYGDIDPTMLAASTAIGAATFGAVQIGFAGWEARKMSQDVAKAIQEELTVRTSTVAKEAIDNSRPVTGSDVYKAVAEDRQMILHPTKAQEFSDTVNTHFTQDQAAAMAHVINQEVVKAKANPIMINVTEAGVDVVPNSGLSVNRQSIEKGIMDETTFLERQNLQKYVEHDGTQWVNKNITDPLELKSKDVAKVLDEIERVFLPDGSIVTKKSNMATGVKVDVEPVVSKHVLKEPGSPGMVWDDVDDMKKLWKDDDTIAKLATKTDMSKEKFLEVLRDRSEELSVALESLHAQGLRNQDVNDYVKILNSMSDTDALARADIALKKGDWDRVSKNYVHYFSDDMLEESWDKHFKMLKDDTSGAAREIEAQLSHIRSTPEYNGGEIRKTAEAAEMLVNGLKGQAGFTSLDLQMHLASSGVSGLLGYHFSDGDPYWAAAFALGGGFLPYAVSRKLGAARIPASGKQTPERMEAVVQAFERGKLGLSTGGVARQVWSKPRNLLPRLGDEGKVFALKLERAHDNYTKAMSHLNADVLKLLVKHKIDPAKMDDMPALHTIRSAMGGSTRLHNIKDPNTKSVALSLKAKFDDLLLQEKKAGLIDDKKYAAIKADRAKHGFFPFVLDDTYLDSPTGEKMWNNILSQASFTRDELKSVVTSIIGNGKGAASVRESILESSSKDKNGRLTLSQWGANALRENRGANPFSIVHSGAPITLLRKHFAPFELDNPMLAFQDYANFSLRRIHTAKKFGGKGEVAHRLAKQVQNKHLESGGEKYRHYMEQLYYHSARDIRSELIQQAAAMSPGLLGKSGIGKLKAYETLKLATAGIVNAGQAYVNGSTKLIRHGMPPWTAHVESMRATINMMKKTNREEILAETGAALESQLLMMVGEASTRAKSIFPEHLLMPKNKVARGALAGARVLNNPTKFLRAVKFTGTEQYVRSVASSQGIGLANYLANQIKKHQASGNLSRLKEAQEGLFELGIDYRRVKSAKDLSDLDLQQAGLRFSNRVNFTMATHEIPPGWQRSGVVEIMRQFKSFAYNHSEFMSTEVLKPAIRGTAKATKMLAKGKPIESVIALKEFAPLINYFGVVGPIIGGATYTAKELIYLALGDDPELNMMSNLLNGWMYVGGLGILLDLYDTAQRNQYAPARALVETVSGPGASTTMNAANNLLRGDAGKFGSDLITGMNKPIRLTWEMMFGE